MKIFLVCNSLGGGGAERVHVNLANGFAQRGHEVYLIADVNQPASYPVDEQVHVLPLCPQSTNKLKKWGGAVSMLRKNIKKYKPDVVIGNMHLCSIICRLAALGTGVPVVLTIHHALESDTYQIGSLIKNLDRYAPKCFTRTVVLTTADKEYMESVYGNQVSVIPNPLSFTPCKSVPKKDNVILAAGRLGDWRYKGWDVLFEAWGKIASRHKDWKLFLAGTGPEESIRVIKDFIKQNDVEDSVELLGFRNDMKALYSSSSIFVLSSRSEGLPMVVIEAMSQGCACVATNYKGRTCDIITSDNEGLLSEPEDVDAIAANLEKLIVNESLRRSIQGQSIERSKYFLIDHVISIWESLLKNIINKSNK